MNDSDLETELRKARKGNREAMQSVYRHYAFGEYDEKSCEFWLRKLAENGHPPSQYNLGMELIDEGRVLDGNKWIKESAAAGYEPARQFLKVLKPKS